MSTVAGALGASVHVAVAVAAVGGLALLGIAAFAVRRADGDRRAFALAVGACIIASPIVWPNYAALLFVPIAVTWPRLAPVWFFGYVTWLLGAIAPKPSVSEVCCRPADVPEQAWAWSHTEPVLWFALGTTLSWSRSSRCSPESLRGVAAHRGASTPSPEQRRDDQALDRDARACELVRPAPRRRKWRAGVRSPVLPAFSWPRPHGSSCSWVSRRPSAARSGFACRRRGSPRRGRLLRAREEHRRRPPAGGSRRAGLRLGRGLSHADRAGVGPLQRPRARVPRGTRNQRARHVAGSGPRVSPGPPVCLAARVVPRRSDDRSGPVDDLYRRRHDGERGISRLPPGGAPDRPRGSAAVGDEPGAGRPRPGSHGLHPDPGPRARRRIPLRGPDLRAPGTARGASRLPPPVRPHGGVPRRRVARSGRRVDGGGRRPVRLARVAIEHLRRVPRPGGPAVARVPRGGSPPLRRRDSRRGDGRRHRTRAHPPRVGAGRLFAAVALPTFAAMWLCLARQRVPRRRRQGEPQRAIRLLRRPAAVPRARALDPGRAPPPRPLAPIVVAACCLLVVLFPVDRLRYNAEFHLLCHALARSAGRERVAPRHGRLLLPGVRSPMVAFDASRHRLVVVTGGRRHDADVHEHFVGDDRLRVSGKVFQGRPATWVDDSIPPGSSVAVVWDERRAQGRTIEPFYQWVMVTEVFNTTVGGVHPLGPATYYGKKFLPTKPVSLRADAVVVEEGQAARCRVRIGYVSDASARDGDRRSTVRGTAARPGRQADAPGEEANVLTLSARVARPRLSPTRFSDALGARRDPVGRPRTPADGQRPRAHRSAMPKLGRPHVASGRNQTADRRGRATPRGTAASA